MARPAVHARAWALLFALKGGRVRLRHVRGYDPKLDEMLEDVILLMEEDLLDRAQMHGDRYLCATTTPRGRYWREQYRRAQVAQVKVKQEAST